MVLFSLCFASGIWLLQQRHSLPDAAWLWVLLPASLLFFLSSIVVPRVSTRKICLAVSAFTLGFSHAALVAQVRLGDSLTGNWQDRNIEIIGIVAELPRQHQRGLRFTFDVEQTLTANVHVPKHILLSTYDRGERFPLHAGERWQFTARLKQPHGTANPNAADFEAWMLGGGLRATGYVRDREYNALLNPLVQKPGYLIERMRGGIRDRFQRILGDSPYAGVLVALAIGDQNSIRAGQWQIFTRTGVNHLMSISGLHITMLSGLAFWLAYISWKRNARLVMSIPAR